MLWGWNGRRGERSLSHILFGKRTKAKDEGMGERERLIWRFFEKFWLNFVKITKDNRYIFLSSPLFLPLSPLFRWTETSLAFQDRFSVYLDTPFFEHQVLGRLSLSHSHFLSLSLTLIPIQARAHTQSHTRYWAHSLLNIFICAAKQSLTHSHIFWLCLFLSSSMWVQIHWFSILNSFMILTFLIGLVAIILVLLISHTLSLSLSLSLSRLPSLSLTHNLSLSFSLSLSLPSSPSGADIAEGLRAIPRRGGRGGAVGVETGVCVCVSLRAASILHLNLRILTWRLVFVYLTLSYTKLWLRELTHTPSHW